MPVGIEAVHVVDAWDVDAGTWIPVPVPRAAEVVGRFENAQTVVGPAQPVSKIEARKPRTDNDDVHIRFFRSDLAFSIIVRS